MGGWKSKFLFLLVVYFAGFATAIYCLVPVSEAQIRGQPEKGLVHSVLKTDKVAQFFRAEMEKIVESAKDKKWCKK